MDFTQYFTFKNISIILIFCLLSYLIIYAFIKRKNTNYKNKTLVSRFLALVIISIIHTSLTAQNAKEEINIRAENQTYAKLFYIDIIRNEDYLKFTFRIRTGKRYDELDKDTTILFFQEQIQKLIEKGTDLRNDTLINYAHKLDSIHYLYTVFKTDSLILNRSSYKEYDSLITETFNTPSDEFEKEKRIVLDGTSFTFNLLNKYSNRKIYAHSPNINSYPLLALLISKSTEIYRSVKQNDFLDKRSMAGY